MLRTLIIVVIALLISFAVSCGDGDGPHERVRDLVGHGDDEETTTEWPGIAELSDDAPITPNPLITLLEVGDRRFAMGLQDEAGELILGATVSYRFYKLDDEATPPDPIEAMLKDEQPARFVSLREGVVVREDDGTLRTIEGPEVGGYVATTDFDEAGDWGVEITGALEDGTAIEPLRFRFNVLDAETGPIPAIGEAAPRTAQTVLGDVQDITEIDSSNPPHPELHEKTIAEALDTGKPVVIAFATPAFCTSRLCGPVVDGVIVPLAETYRGRVEFVHVEPYDLNRARSGEGLVSVPAMQEWGLQSEPWVFVIDAQGNVAAKFEGITDQQEVDAALQQALG